MVLWKLRLFSQTPKHSLKLYQSSTKQLPSMLAYTNWSRAVLMDQRSLLSPALHSVANLMSLSHCCTVRKPEDEQSQKNFRYVEVSTLALNGCGIQLIEALFGSWEWFLAFCACTHPKYSLYRVMSQPGTPPQKPAQFIFHCQEP